MESLSTNILNQPPSITCNTHSALCCSSTITPSGHSLFAFLRNEKLLFLFFSPLPLEPSIKREDGRFKKKKKKKINIWSTQLFCTPLNVNEAEALITVATVDKHNALSTHSQRREGKEWFFFFKKKGEINGFAWLKRFDSEQNSAIFVILMILSVNNPIKGAVVPTSKRK